MEEDKRFDHVKNDPKFRRIPKGVRKVKIDKRFECMFKDKEFNVKYTVDKTGRPVNTTSSKDLRHYYDLESESSDSEQEENDLEVKSSSDKAIPTKIREKLQDLKVDYARGESKLLEESSSDDESEIEEDENDKIEHKWGELDNDANQTEEVTFRLAACNMNWDRIRAMDLMVLFNSFLPAGGVIKSVIIYPSEFGKERMKEEDIKGPIELVENNEETEDGSNYHMEKLRQYQLNRLKYYYAIITFDSAASANKIYLECDGMEYESSATKIDLRFVPDDMTFDNEPREICDKLPELNKYQPRFFTTTALQQAKVDLTWDETDPDRLELAQKLTTGKVEEIDETLLKNFVAVSSSEEETDVENVESDNDDPINKYKALLQNIEDKEVDKKNEEIEMEVSWGIDLKEKTDKLIKEKLNDKEEKTPFEKYLDKRKEKRKQKRLEKKSKSENNEDSDLPSDIDMNDPYFAEEFNKEEFKKKKIKSKVLEIEDDVEKDAELQLLLMDEDDGRKHFNLKKIQENETKQKNKKKKKISNEPDDNFQVNVKDERFSALFTSHLYSIDPSDPHFKKTKGMENLIQAIIKERPNREEVNTKKVKLSEEAKLNVSVKAIKRKALYRKKK